MTAGDLRADVVVVGAGINGSGIARDAALRGLGVVVVDQEDVGAGTTSTSTRLIHGGLRYLEHLEFPLVRESLRERETLLRIAAHLVRPLAFLIPIYTGNARGPVQIRMGMLAYDALSLQKSLKHHHMLDRGETLSLEPGLNPRGLRAAALYHDGQIEYPERLTLENALSAREQGAEFLTHTRVVGFVRDGQTVCGVEVEDLLDGTRRTILAPMTVNAAGPWADAVLRTGLGRPPARLIGGTKGSHLVVGPFPGAPRQALYVEAERDHRPYFVVPWNGRYLIGTTDVRYDGDPGEAAADDEEIDYLVRETNRVLPGANLTHGDILYTWSGVRPLPYAPGRRERAITRRHILHDHAPDVQGLVSIAGGKLTTYRHLAEQVTDLVLRKLGRRPVRCVTDEQPLPGCRTGDFAAFSDGFVEGSALDRPLAERLLRVYGTRASEVLRLAQSGAGLDRPLVEGGDAIAAEIVLALRDEGARTLTDVLLRRTMLGLGDHVGLDVAAPAARVAREHLGWDEARADREVAAYRSTVERMLPAARRRAA